MGLLSPTDDDPCIVKYTVDGYYERFLIPDWDEDLLVIGGAGVRDVPGGSIRIHEKGERSDN